MSQFSAAPSNPSSESSCVGRTLQLGGAGFVAGSFFGACMAAWQDISLKEMSSFQAFTHSFRVTARHGVLFGSVCGLFFAADCLLESLRGQRDIINNLAGGVATGAYVLARTSNSRYAFQMSAGITTVAALALLVEQNGGFNAPAQAKQIQSIQYAADHLFPAAVSQRQTSPIIQASQSTPEFLRVQEKD